MKKDWYELAIFSEEPIFKEKLHVGCPNIGNRLRLVDRINDILDRRWLTNNGPYVQEFEQKIAKTLGARHCIAMNNGTVALEITIRALGLTGEVIIPAFTFIATAHALQWQEITPVFCDIDHQSCNINPCRVEQLITPHTTGIIGVHLWGRSCDVDALANIARRYNLKLLFDAAHAFGCSHQGQMIGNFGDAEVFSFHATKFINTFEGGATVTNDDELAARIRLMKNFGFAGYDDVVYIGTNGKMSEIAAVMGLTSLESLEEFIVVNHQNYKHYQQHLAELPGISLLTYDHNEKCNYQYIIISIDEAITKISRDQLMKVLQAENVLARRYFYPGCHRMEPYRSCFPHADLLLHNTNRLATRVLSLPTGTAIGLDEITKICQIIRLAISHAEEIKERFTLSIQERHVPC